MKQYFYLIGTTQSGPFDIEELKAKRLSYDTYIWTEGMKDWQRIIDNLDLQEAFKTNVSPPPPPVERGQLTTKKEISSNARGLDEKSTYEESSPFKPTSKQLFNYLIWVCCHVVIFLLTKTDVDFFKGYSRSPERFWPFTSEFFAGTEGLLPGMSYNCQTRDGKPCFYGIFADYDVSELLIYSVVPVVLFFLYRLKKNINSKKA
jgi:hypothetical protein